MPKVTNTSTGTSVDCEDGANFQDLAQTNDLGIPFGCENGICSTCLITIGSGMDNLNERTDQEEMTLDARGADDNVRLACQCKVNGDVSFE
jgi:ferredoxin